MGKVKWKGGALLAPVPAVMVTCGNAEHANIITVAWCGIVSTIPPKVYISVRPERYSYGIIKESGEFVINLTTRNLVRSADWCGVYTGRKVNKFARCALTKEASNDVAPPSIAESPLSLECRVTDVIPLGSHDMFIADVLSVSVDETLIDADGKLHLDRASLAAFAHGEYFELGKPMGTFGFSVRKKKKKRPGTTPSGNGKGDGARVSKSKKQQS